MLTKKIRYVESVRLKPYLENLITEDTTKLDPSPMVPEVAGFFPTTPKGLWPPGILPEMMSPMTLFSVLGFSLTKGWAIGSTWN